MGKPKASEHNGRSLITWARRALKHHLSVPFGAVVDDKFGLLIMLQTGMRGTTWKNPGVGLLQPSPMYPCCRKYTGPANGNLFKEPSIFIGSLKEELAIVGALIIRIGFWGPLYYTYNKEPPS